ncbi:unnamed protein product [Medioppia subpectinata]|uniref:Uncharacterized protein n=1 Tax=Medioppia subpectinata TaxID=1979941 RepID=A0A7R9KV80_9ACAR|nr:unnamed protein product [Medioppia subpectinata]CAG2110086.1 unnamed protein product [Medioppia subpectinata]
MEACESGSMWANFLPNNINVYAVASSKAGQISRQAFCYFKPNKDMDYCHGSLFSHYWLLDSERTDLSKETLQQQFDYIFKTGNLIDPIIVPSHEIPQQSLQFGDLSIAKLSVSEFMGNRAK